jgi:hypothetical protein
MALTAYELGLTGNSQSIDFNNKGSATRTFVVETISPQAALAADGVPTINSQHPTLTGLILDAVTVEPQDTGVCNVVCRYSNSRQFGSTRTPNKDNPRWYHWGWASRTVQIDIPVAVKTKVIAKDQFGNGDERLVWRISHKYVNETRIIRPLNVRVKVQNVRDLDIIAKQKDRLHAMPDGKLYHFEGATVNQVDDNGTYDIAYIWELDEGTDKFPDFETDNARYCVQVTNGQVPESPDAGPIFRNPYTVFVAYQIGDPSETIPNCELNALYPVDETGWTNLPGANLII